MDIIITSTSLYSAFQIFKRDVLEEVDVEKQPKFLDNFVDLDRLGYDNNSEIIDDIRGKGIIYGYTLEDCGVNSNKTLVSIQNIAVTGDKKWKTMYAAVYDHPGNYQDIPECRSEIKKEAIDKGREYAESEKRNVFICIYKAPIEFTRTQAIITYKPSIGQKLGRYCFVW